MVTLATLASFLIFAIIVCVVLSLIYYAIMQVPFFTPWAWAVRAVFALLVALLIIEYFSGGMGFDRFRV
jgi:hypothetical protein